MLSKTLTLNLSLLVTNLSTVTVSDVSACTSIAVALFLLFTNLSTVSACTSIAIAKGALKDGSTLVTQSDDAEGDMDYRVVYVPRRKKTHEGEMRPCYSDKITMPRLYDAARAKQYAENLGDTSKIKELKKLEREIKNSKFNSIIANSKDSNSETSDKDENTVTKILSELKKMEDVQNDNFITQRDETRPHFTHNKDRIQLPEILGYIPEVDETYAYFDGFYALQNEYQVGFGESTCSARIISYPRTKVSLNSTDSTESDGAMFHIGSLSKIAAERCKTARCAVQLMGQLAYDHGFYGSPSVNGAGENLMVNDVDEAWVFHILGTPDSRSAVWAAQRVPDGHVATVANAFQIRKMDLENTDYYLASPNMISLAKELGFYDPVTDGDFDFVRAYSAGEYTSPYYSGRRHWRVFDKVAPLQQLNPELGWNREEPTYPFSVPVDEPIEAIEKLPEIYRDYYENTPYSLVMEGNMAAGPFGNPARYDQGKAEHSSEFNYNGAWERSIGLYRTTMINLSQARKGKDSGVLWIAHSRPEASVFVPLMMSSLKGDEKENEIRNHYPLVSEGSNWMISDNLWWSSQKLAHFMETKFRPMQNEVKPIQLHLETVVAPKIVAEVDKTGDTSLLKNYHERVLKEIKDTHDYLQVKYQNGYELSIEDGVVDTPGYPKWWLEGVDYGKSATIPTEMTRELKIALETFNTQGKMITAIFENVAATELGKSGSSDDSGVSGQNENLDYKEAAEKVREELIKTRQSIDKAMLMIANTKTNSNTAKTSDSTSKNFMQIELSLDESKSDSESKSTDSEEQQMQSVINAEERKIEKAIEKRALQALALKEAEDSESSDSEESRAEKEIAHSESGKQTEKEALSVAKELKKGVEEVCEEGKECLKKLFGGGRGGNTVTDYVDNTVNTDTITDFTSLSENLSGLMSQLSSKLSSLETKGSEELQKLTAQIQDMVTKMNVKSVIENAETTLEQAVENVEEEVHELIFS